MPVALSPRAGDSMAPGGKLVVRTSERAHNQASTASTGDVPAVSGAVPMAIPAVEAPVRLVLALADPERERELLPVLHEAGAFTVVERCLAAAQLLECVRTSRVDAALVAYDLHRLGREQLAALMHGGVPLLLFTPPDAVREAQEDAERVAHARRRTVVVSLGTAPYVVRQALEAVLRGQPWALPAAIETEAHRARERVEMATPDGPGPNTPLPAMAPVFSAAAAGDVPNPATAISSTPFAGPGGSVAQEAAAHTAAVGNGRSGRAALSLETDHRHSLSGAVGAAGAPAGAMAGRGVLPPLRPAARSVIAVGGGQGSPGRTTIALNLAVALGAVAPTVLVDLDLVAPAIASYLGADPTRNVYMLAHGQPESPRGWERALEQELQPLASRSPHGRVLCGVPKPEMRGGLSAHFMGRLLAELRQRYQYVVLDLGAFSQLPETTLCGPLLQEAGQVLLVAAADVVGLSHARTALAAYRGYPGAALQQVALVVNRHDRRYHYGRSEIEWALGAGAAAVVPFDHSGVERAVAAQRPLVLDRRSRAARALMELADRLHGGSVLLPPEPSTNGCAGWGSGTLATLLPSLPQRPFDALRRLWPLRTGPLMGAAGPGNADDAGNAGEASGSAATGQETGRAAAPVDAGTLSSIIEPGQRGQNVPEYQDDPHDRHAGRHSAAAGPGAPDERRNAA